jgi:glycosyltransferase involved in cell wall biosynthesis
VYNGVFSEKVFLQLGALGEQKVRFADDKQYTFVIVGLIHPHKGQSEALKALARMMIKYPQARLQVIGGGDTQPLKALAQKLKIAQNVTFLGEVANVHQYLLEADACLVCARNEAFGRVTVEAMACRCPVIGFKSGGTAEIIRHEHNGLLYEKGSEQLAKAMERLVREHELCQQMIHKAWQEAFRQYTDEACLSQILTVYHELHPNKKPQP